MAAALAVAYEKPAGYYQVTQNKCQSMGDSFNTFEVKGGYAKEILSSVGRGIKEGQLPAPDRFITSNIDEDKIIQVLSNVDFSGNDQGLIPAFGVILTHMFANYYNRISFEFERILTQATQEPALAALLLIEAGQDCAFNTFGGIMKSDEWYGLVYPMCQSREDWVHGIIAVVNTLGMGTFRVKELIPGKRLVLRIFNGYEANGYLGMYGESSLPRSYLATGATAGIMNLIYHGDITQKPRLDEAYYHEIFSSKGAFRAVQIKSRMTGDDYDEFVAEKP